MTTDNIVHIRDNIESCKDLLSKYAEPFGLSIDDVVKMIDSSRDQLLYMASIGVLVNDVQYDTINSKFTYYISVPNKSETMIGNKMIAGKEAAANFKDYIIKSKHVIHPTVASIDVDIRYIERDETWNFEKFSNTKDEINRNISKNPLFPFSVEVNKNE